MKIAKITNVIARDTWTADGKNGVATTYEIIVGKPRLIPHDKNHDWFCPVWIENYTSRIIPAYGVGPVDSLMNAMTLVKSFSDEIHKKKANNRLQSASTRCAVPKTLPLEGGRGK